MAKILIIDDEDYIRQIIKRTIVKLGHEVFEASQGLEGIELITNNKFDLVIIDLIMPGKGGIETILELKHKYPHLNFIIVTGKIATDSDAFNNLIRQFGVKYLFQKPIRKAELCNAVTQLLENN